MKWAHFCTRTNRFKVKRLALDKPCYLFVKRFKDLANEITNEELDEGSLAKAEATLDESVDNMRIKLAVLTKAQDPDDGEGNADNDEDSDASERPDDSEAAA